MTTLEECKAADLRPSLNPASWGISRAIHNEALRHRRFLLGEVERLLALANNMHDDSWWQAELDRCVGIEQDKYRNLFSRFAAVEARLDSLRPLIAEIQQRACEKPEDGLYVTSGGGVGRTVKSAIFGPEDCGLCLPCRARKLKGEG